MTTITIERAILDRLIFAWDSTVLPKSRDGMMQERMEDLRAALSAPATAPSHSEEEVQELLDLMVNKFDEPVIRKILGVPAP